MNYLSLNKGKLLGLPSLALLLAALLGPLATAQATDWGFALVGRPTVENDEGDEHETLGMTGAGTFNPDDGTAAGGGAFSLINAFDDAAIGGPKFHGTWKVTDFISFDSQGGLNRGLQGGTLKVEILFTFIAGLNPELRGLVNLRAILTLVCPFVDGAFVESDDAISVDMIEIGEVFSTNPTGFVGFHKNGKP